MPFPTATILTAGTNLFLQKSVGDRTLPINTVTVSAGVGSGATGTAVLTATAVSSVTVSAGGTGYTVAPNVVFSGGGGTGASATAVLTAGVVTSVVIVTGGTGYSTAPTVAFTTSPGIGATVISVTVVPTSLFVAGQTTAFYKTADTVIQQGDKLTFNSTIPQTVTVANDVLLGATSITLTAPLVNALQAGNVATSNGLLAVQGVDTADFKLGDKKVSTRSLSSGLWDENRKVMLSGSFSVSGIYRVGDDAQDQVFLPASLDTFEVYCKLVYPDGRFRQGYAMISDYAEPIKLDDIVKFSATINMNGAVSFG